MSETLLECSGKRSVKESDTGRLRPCEIPHKKGIRTRKTPKYLCFKL
tara:strand:+ start:34042 stop:34182 length:141 start_codon:yes stop_codon:yes gene_type:complete